MSSIMELQFLCCHKYLRAQVLKAEILDSVWNFQR